MLRDEIQNEMLKAINIKIRSMISNLSFNRYIEGRIISVDTANKKCTVKINESESTMPYRDGITLNIGDVVMIMIPNNNFSAKFVDLKRPKYR
jgi:tRNA A58 N-methylase Trm61